MVTLVPVTVACLLGAHGGAATVLVDTSMQVAASRLPASHSAVMLRHQCPEGDEYGRQNSRK